jgi:hypothetical protein
MAPIKVDLVLDFIAVSGVFLPAAGGNCLAVRVAARRTGLEMGLVGGFDMGCSWVFRKLSVGLLQTVGRCLNALSDFESKDCSTILQEDR